ncbi:MAG: hypothetical protein DCC75_07725, partial [Proteobacteria bacterium]
TEGAARGSTTRVSVVGHNGPSKLMFMVPPDLASGDYALEVRSTLGNGTLHKACKLFGAALIPCLYR